MKKVLCSALLVLSYCAAMVDLNHEMLHARSLQEFEEAPKHTLADAVEDRNRKLAAHYLTDSQPILADMFGGVPGFYHGVASGDPYDTSVIVWTRYTPIRVDEPITLELRMAMVDATLAVEDHLDPTKNANLHRANVIVTAESDFIAKIDVTGLEPGAHYVFAFSDGTSVSTVGRTRTAPGPNDTVDSMIYAVFSCSHMANGYFHAYDIASTIKDLDFWVHTGDYVYEYGSFSTYASDSPERKAQILPEWEQISLQDHRNRMASYHQHDEGLTNLRARAPLIATWDDHESTNNPYGDGTVENTGAQNHQPVCPANVTSPDSEKAAANCDRDEGEATVRFTHAAQSYLEWMPIRRYPGTMGVVEIGAINQVVSWGDMATIVTFDTRLSHRSKDPTINSSTFGPFTAFATENTNVTEYSTILAEELDAVASTVKELLESDEFTMIGDEGISFLETNFAESSAKGQPWQIWATATAMGRAVKGDYSSISKYTSDAEVAAAVDEVADGVYNSSAFLRGLTGQSLTSTPWNRDDFSGFAYEQRKILASLKNSTNNPIILAGDLHDGYGWTLYEDGAVDGTPCAVNLVCPGVTSPGWGPVIYNPFSSLADVVGGADVVYNMLEMADEEANPGLKYFNHQFKGFFAVKATKETHVAEYFVIRPDVILTDYETARSESGSIVADFMCDTQLTTTAGMPGSLDRVDECSAIEFESERSVLSTIPFPISENSAELPVVSDCGFQECSLQVGDSPSPKCPPLHSTDSRNLRQS